MPKIEIDAKAAQIGSDCAIAPDDDVEIGVNDQDISGQLRAALRRMPGPVALVTGADPDDGAPAGLVASAVIPVSMDPPSMLVAINRSASAHPAIANGGRFCINLLCNSQTAIVSQFADQDRRSERFSGEGWAVRNGLRWLPAACVSIFCEVERSEVFGTHALFIGTVQEVIAGSGSDPMGWIEGGFARLHGLEATL